MVMDKPLRSKLFITLLHISAWSIVFILPLLFDKSTPPPPTNFRMGMRRPDFQLISTLMNLSFIPLFYFNSAVLVPRFFNRKSWYVYSIAVLLSIGVIAIINIATRHFFGIHHPFPPLLRIFLLLSGCILITSTAYSLIQKNIEDEQLRKERQAENLKTELSFLRSQVSPHFLFNTLNNLVSLARKKSDLLEPSLLKLSGLLQYMLYESDQEKISIHKEIEYLDNYIDLQKLRFGADVKVVFRRELSPTSSVEVVPMILIPFVENAFKHGAVLVSNPEINIQLILTKERLQFRVMNRYRSEAEEKDKVSGIGLANVRRRLNLLYPDYELHIDTSNNFHIVNLLIKL